MFSAIKFLKGHWRKPAVLWLSAALAFWLGEKWVQGTWYRPLCWASGYGGKTTAHNTRQYLPVHRLVKNITERKAISLQNYAWEVWSSSGPVDLSVSEKCSPCSSNPCQNQGRCHNDPVHQYKCSCPQGYKVLITHYWEVLIIFQDNIPDILSINTVVSTRPQTKIAMTLSSKTNTLVKFHGQKTSIVCCHV